MNSIQKTILVIAAIIAVYMLLTAPKYYHLYSQSGHYYKETPFPGAKKEINYSQLIPKLISIIIIISGTLIAILSKTKIRKITRKESYLLILSGVIIIFLSISHFYCFGENCLYLLSAYYYTFLIIIFVSWLIYFAFIKKVLC